VRSGRLAALLGSLVVLALASPAAAPANHVSITAAVSAVLKERVSSRSWLVGVSWAADCRGAAAGQANYQGSLNLVDTANGDTIFLGGASSGSGDAEQLVGARTHERKLRPEYKVSCFESGSNHGSGVIEVVGPAVVIPAIADGGDGRSTRGGGGGGGGGGPGSVGGDPTEPLRNGGCVKAIQGTARPDTLTGSGHGDVIFGYGAGDRIRGRGGHDCLLGGRGNDVLRGDGGSDKLTGGRGNDRLYGGSGVNRYDAGSGNDYVNARNGRREVVRCGRGRDRARVDRRDRVRSCERVRRSRR
jgi:Ca2+-binding RTX toxin-like protein